MNEHESNAKQDKPAEPPARRCYGRYGADGSLDFCPVNDLNLPADQAEVAARFKRLQGARAMEVLN